MSERTASARSWIYRFRLALISLAVSLKLPSNWFQAKPPPESERAARTGRLEIEIVSHCWGYAHLLAYQLSSLLRHPPAEVAVTVTVFHAREDRATRDMLEFFGSMDVANVRWNWQPLAKERLFRRSIGRNQAALQSTADWLWFNDCDVIFGENCLDTLGQALQGRLDALVYPRSERVSPMYEPGHPVLEAAREPRLVDVDRAAFRHHDFSRAVGAMQITHGDVARACGYCRDLAVFQQPTDRFAKAREDRAYRWLLGTEGVPIDIPGIFRIRHQAKGRYHNAGFVSRWRTRVRAIQFRWRERRRGDD